jgi:hypothetical protein
MAEVVTPLGVRHIDFRPGWRQNNSVMISVRLRQGGKARLACQTLEGGCGIAMTLTQFTT